MKNNQKEFHLLEYEMAQSSAEHHDNLLWSVSTLTWGVSGVLLGFVLNNLSVDENHALKLCFCILGLFIISCAWGFTYQFRSLRNQKYKRCLELEALFKFTQHTNIQHKKGSQMFFYSGVMVLFIVTWLLVLSTVIANWLGVTFL